MQTIWGRYKATFNYHNDIETEVPDNATPEEIQQALKEEAEINFDEIAQIANGMTPYIEIMIDEGEVQIQEISCSDEQSSFPKSALIINFPKNIKKKVMDLALESNLSWLTFYQRISEEYYALEVSVENHDRMVTAIEKIKASGLIDDDGEECWFRYKDVLVSYQKGYNYWFNILTSDMDDYKEFDVRELSTYGGDDRHIEAYIKAAIDSGEIEKCYS